MLWENVLQKLDFMMMDQVKKLNHVTIVAKNVKDQEQITVPLVMLITSELIKVEPVFVRMDSLIITDNQNVPNVSQDVLNVLDLLITYVLNQLKIITKLKMAPSLLMMDSMIMEKLLLNVTQNV